jgi:hypothetical protein
VARIGIGDVFETATEHGPLYVQLTHDHDEYGELIRVLGGTHDPCSDDVEALAAAPDVWRGFYPLRAAVRQGHMSPVGHAPVPAERAAFPTFKIGQRDPRTGDVAQWWLWDGEREWRVDALDADQRELPDRGIVNHAGLLWAVLGEEPEGGPAPGPGAVHYLYFGDEAAARRAQAEAGGEVAPSVGDETTWLLTVRGGADTAAVDALEARLVAVAERHGGEYDGHEIAIR